MSGRPVPFRYPPTQKDIALIANVSQATVSIVLNGDPNAPLPDATRQKVLRAAKSIGYVPNRAAQSLRTRKTRTIACVFPDITNPFYPALERGAQNAAEAHGYDLLIYNTDGIETKERKCLDQLLQGRVDGVVAIFFHLTAKDLRPLLEREIAMVRIEARPRAIGPWPLDNLFVDNAAAAKAAIEYLIGRGHSRIAMIAGNAGPDSARVRGYLDALDSKGLKSNLVSGRDFSEAQGYKSTRKLLRHSHPPTAIFAGNDIMAMGAMMAARERHLKIPSDLAVVGFDDIPVARLIAPPLTTVGQFQQKLGRRAVEMLIERLDGAVSGDGRCEEMPFQLIIRQSA